MTKQQSLVVITGCLVAVLMCIGVVAIVHQSAQALPSERDAVSHAIVNDGRA